MTALVTDGGRVIDLGVERWHAPPDDVEQALLATLADPVIDLGCGPGRMVAALVASGRMALGVDSSPAAVGEAQRRRAPVLQRSIFDPLPGERRWGTTLLLDGNVGIGGDPVGLLGRCAQLLRRGGEMVAQVEAPGVPTERLTVRLETAEHASGWFPWARVGVDGFGAVAEAAGLKPVGFAVGGDRWFARAVRP